METIIITRIAKAKDAKMLLSINKRFGKSKMLRGKAFEDFLFAQQLDEGMKSMDIPLEKVHRELRK